MLVTCAVFHEPMGWLNAKARLNMLSMSVTCAVSHLLMSSLNELGSKTPPHHHPMQFRNKSDMSVTRLVSQLGMSSHPAAPHRAELGFAQFGSVEQQFAPDVTFPIQ
mmetsp:Transcript_363/g.1652  ORF Transcript_363/g.1652 Transcript_363/m.1652 type:complete len:107 (-) Transcript_363:194-514(-)